MTHRFDPQTINDPFGDPGVYVDLLFERRALLFDIGEITPLAPRKLLRISDVFVTHRHMDHFVGFDTLLRCLLGRESTVNIHGPSGIIDAVEHKLRAYSWNLIAGYEGNVAFRVIELNEDGQQTIAKFAGRSGFKREPQTGSTCEDGLLLREPGFEVRSAWLDHGIPTLAFAIKERSRINIWRNRVEAMGLQIGPWLGSFKAAVLKKDPDDMPIDVVWASNGPERPQQLPLGTLKKEIMRITSGRKIAYVVDAAFTEANAKKIVSLARAADILFIEAAFLQADATRAEQRRHLTAHQAGTLARFANVKRLVTLHYSPRYHGRGECLAREAELAFRAAKTV
jgi:ribonuclease Z